MDLLDSHRLPELVEAVAASVAVVGAGKGDAGRILAWNGRFRSMLGLGKDEAAGRMLREILPRYAWREIRRQMQECACTVAPVEMTQPLDAEGETRWWRLSAQPLVTGDGEPVAILLTCIEITEKVALENELKTVNSRFGAVIQSAYDGIVTIDRDQRIGLFNAAAEEMFGYAADEVVGKPLDVLIPERHRDRHYRHVGQFADSPIRSRQMFERGGRITGLARDGTEFPVEVSISKITVGGATEFTAVIRDISERARLIDELHRQATIDLLTGLLNRRAFYTRAAEHIALARRYRHPLSLIILDLDRFKRINDSHGHAAGDMVLRATASAGGSALRKSDIFARLGGEEFAVLLPETDEIAAGALAERLCRTIEAGDFEHDWDDIAPIPFTASFGVAPVLAKTEMFEEALKRADDALYAAKESGRNRVVLWSDLTEGAGASAPAEGGADPAVRVVSNSK